MFVSHLIGFHHMTSLCLILLLWAIVYGLLAGTLGNPVAFKMSHMEVTTRIQTILEALQGLYEARVTILRKHFIMYSRVIIPLLSRVLSTTWSCPIYDHEA